MHYRWGDISHVCAADFRTGATLQQYLETLKWVKNLLAHNIMVGEKMHKGSRAVRTFLFAEGQPEEFVSAKEMFPDIDIWTDSDTWLETIDVMSQSQVVIGGRSSFFALGTNLNDGCFSVNVPDKLIQRFPHSRSSVCDENVPSDTSTTASYAELPLVN